MEEKIKNDKVIMYGSPTCPMVPPMLGLLKQAKVDYNYINIAQDESAREQVREINNGYESVPTFIFPDGSTLTEPSAGEVKGKLQQFGYEVPFTAMLMGNIWMILVAAAIAFALLRAFGIF